MMAALSVAQRQRNARGVPGTGKGKAQSRTPPGRTPNLQPSTFNLQPSTFNPSLSYHRPMFVDRIDRVRRHLRDFVQEYFQVTPDPLVVESPPSVDLGDLAFPLPFELARVLRRPPRQIAQEIAEKVPGLEGVERFEAAGAGYRERFPGSLRFSARSGHLAGTPAGSAPAGQSDRGAYQHQPQQGCPHRTLAQRCTR